MNSTTLNIEKSTERSHRVPTKSRHELIQRAFRRAGIRIFRNHSVDQYKEATKRKIEPRLAIERGIVAFFSNNPLYDWLLTMVGLGSSLVSVSLVIAWFSHGQSVSYPVLAVIFCGFTCYLYRLEKLELVVWKSKRLAGLSGDCFELNMVKVPVEVTRTIDELRFHLNSTGLNRDLRLGYDHFMIRRMKDPLLYLEDPQQDNRRYYFACWGGVPGLEKILHNQET